MKYIYNIEQANYYIEIFNIKPIRVGLHTGTKKVFFVFSIEETQEAYESWVFKK